MAKNIFKAGLQRALVVLLGIKVERNDHGVAIGAIAAIGFAF